MAFEEVIIISVKIISGQNLGAVEKRSEVVQSKEVHWYVHEEI